MLSNIDTKLWILPHLLVVFSFVLAFLLIARAQHDRRTPASTLAWLLAIILVPYIGVPLYLLIGERKVRRKAGQKNLPVWSSPALEPLNPVHALERLLIGLGGPPARGGNRVEALPSGEETWRRFMELIDGAKTSIHIATFILGRSGVGREILHRLGERAESGVEVRLLLDAVGSFRVSGRDLKRFARTGARYAWFHRVLHGPWRGHSNLRNHRKIAVFDGKTAIIGGMNLAQVYMGPTPHPKRWKDLALIVQGAAVADIHRIFRLDWYYAAQEELQPVCDADEIDPHGPDTLQVVASGPDTNGDPLYESIMQALSDARERIDLATPYFIPDNGIQRNLLMALHRGVQVRILLPRRSNHFTCDLVRTGYLREIEQAGARILLYEPRMMHAKLTLIDEELAVIGSANMDMRSLFYNYEIAVMCYSAETVSALRNWMDALCTESQHGLKEAGSQRLLLENVGRLIAPLI